MGPCPQGFCDRPSHEFPFPSPDHINELRVGHMGLEPVLPGEHGGYLLNSKRVPFAKMWSPAFVPKPNDWVGGWVGEPREWLRGQGAGSAGRRGDGDWNGDDDR
jgi:hypothetical protein